MLNIHIKCLNINYKNTLAYKHLECFLLFKTWGIQTLLPCTWCKSDEVLLRFAVGFNTHTQSQKINLIPDNWNLFIITLWWSESHPLRNIFRSHFWDTMLWLSEWYTSKSYFGMCMGWPNIEVSATFETWLDDFLCDLCWSLSVSDPGYSKIRICQPPPRISCPGLSSWWCNNNSRCRLGY